MPRRPPRVLVAASAVLLAAVVGLWVRSYWRWDRIAHVRQSREAAAVGSFCGSLVGAWRWDPPLSATKPGWAWHTDSVGHEPPKLRRYFEQDGWYCIGFGVRRKPPGGGGGSGGSAVIGVPYWFPAVIATLPLASAVVARRRWPPPGHCQSCGYDLTGNASGRCPECGAAITHIPAGRGS